MRLHISKAILAMALSVLAVAGCSKNNEDDVLRISSDSPAVKIIDGRVANVELTSAGGVVPFTLSRTYGLDFAVLSDAS